MEQGTVYSMRAGADPAPADAVRVDRATEWGNPFKVGTDGTLPEVIQKYRAWLWKRMKDDASVIDRLAAIAGRDVKCWCAPKACHGDIVVAAAVWAAQTREEN